MTISQLKEIIDQHYDQNPNLHVLLKTRHSHRGLQPIKVSFCFIEEHPHYRNSPIGIPCGEALVIEEQS